VKLSKKRFVAALIGLFAIGWSGMAFAQATTITTMCPPANFKCAFSAAETMSFLTPKTVGSPGQPDVYLGYIVFDPSGSGMVTMTGVQNVNGTVGPIGIPPSGSSIPVLSSSTPCANGLNGQPATITFTDNSEISFVTGAGGTELQFILSKDKNTSSTKNTNSVRIGVCRQQ